LTADLKIAVAGGGTGGHLFPALAIIQELENRLPTEVEYFGSRRGPEARIVPAKGYKFHNLWIKGYPRKIKIEVFILPVRFLVSLFQSLYHLLKFWPHCLLATGGYVCLPFMLAGKLIGKPIVLQEQNRLPGITTKIGAYWAEAVFFSFPDSEKYFKGHRFACLSGNPARSDLGTLPSEQAKLNLGLNPDKKTILVFGGSQGSATLNKAVTEALNRLAPEYNLIWQTGQEGLFQNPPANVLVRKFFEDMGTVYSASDLVFCRAGAMTLTELAAVGLPAVLIPFPYAAEDHQRLNALSWAQTGAAIMVLDRDFNAEILLNLTKELLNDPQKLKEMSSKARSFHRPQAAKIIADKILDLLQKP
jgi:UDP-N-acetylglucosamine--N-acetylmuramyl-(pentapeptide) pyrophosphoryl-undecaprenol N-acetylglucosamine transferase